MGKKKTAALTPPSPTVVIKKEPNNEPMQPEPPQPPSPTQASSKSTKLSPKQKLVRHQERLRRLKVAGLLEQYTPICNKYDAALRAAKAKYTESRKPVSQKNVQLLLHKPKKATANGTEIEKTRYRDYQKQTAECGKIFITLKAELASTTAALEKTRDDAIDRLLTHGIPSKPPASAPGPPSGKSSSASQPFLYAPVPPVALPSKISSRPAIPQGSPSVLPLLSEVQVKQEEMEDKKGVLAASKVVPVARKAVPVAIYAATASLPAGTMVLPNKVLRKAAGECILRAVLHILSRRSAYISRELFKKLYRELYGTDIGSYSRFNQKPWKKFLDCTTTKKGTYYRLNPSYFSNLAEAFRLPYPAMTCEGDFVEVSSKSILPPITPIDPLLIRGLVVKLDLSLMNLHTTDRELLPRALPADVPLQDFQKYLPIWNKVTPSRSHGAGSEQLPLPKKLKIADVTPEIYDQYIEAATMTPGMQAKRTKKVLTAYSAKMTRPIEEQRQAFLNSSLGVSSSTEGAEENSDLDMSNISEQSNEDTHHPQAVHLGFLPDTNRVENGNDQDMSGASDISIGGTQQSGSVHSDQDMSDASDFSNEAMRQPQSARGDQDMNGVSDYSDGTQQSGAANGDQDMSEASDMSDIAIQKPAGVQQRTSTPLTAVNDRPSTTTTPTRFAPYPGRNTATSAQKQGEGALLLVASARKSDKDKATTVGAIRSQKDFFKRPVVSGGVQSSSESKSFLLPRPNLPEDPNRRPLPTWESQVRRSRFSGMSRLQLHEARKEAREFLIDWMWSLPLRHGRDCPDKVQL